MKLKISRLFHWLYATLMFLPILMFIPSCIYYGFNEHANANITQDTYLNFYQYVQNGKPVNFEHWQIDVDTVDYPYTLENGYLKMSLQSEDNFIFAHIGNTCSFSADDKLFFSFSAYTIGGFDNYIDLFFNDQLDNVSTGTLNSFDTKYQYIMSFGDGDIVNNDLELWIGTNAIFSGLSYIYIKDIQLFNLTQIFGNGNEPSADVFGSYLTQPYYNYGICSVLISKGRNITDNLNDAFNHLFDLPLFSWTKNTFVSVPFTYITGLFGLSTDNPLNYLFGYFVTVSICWLVFDLIMYVPNLAHRWLDRSAIE